MHRQYLLDQVSEPTSQEPVRSERAGPRPVARRTNSRRSFLRGAAVAAAAAVPAGLAISHLTVEVAAQERNERVEQNFRDIRRHENAHVQFLVDALGNQARPRPTFRNLGQRTYRDFVATSKALENTGVGAYLGSCRCK